MALRPAALVTSAFALAMIAVALVTSHGPDPVAEAPPEPPTLSATIPDGPEPAAAPGEISVLTLAREMADLAHLARLPDVPFVAGLAASTDRRSRQAPLPGQPGDVGWYANDDFVTPTQANLVRVEPGPDGEDRYVLLDARGPGAVVRLWTATPTGTLRIYIDDDPRPVVEAAFRDLLAGDVAPFVAPLAHVTARGYNLFFPFPYRRRCVVTVDSIVSADPFSDRELAKLYYQIGYRTYPPEQAANVRPYAAAEVTRAARAIWRAATGLRDGPSADAPPPAPGGRTVTVGASAIDAAHPAIATIKAPAGGGRLSELRLSGPAGDRTALGATEIAIAFDGEETVRAPLAFFFGSGSGLTSYGTLPLAVLFDGTLICRFSMPFRERAVVTLSHRGPGAVRLAGTATIDAAPFDERTLLFHARHRGPTRLPTRPFRDWSLGTLTGHGALVGAVLSVENPPGTMWWGEGDEKIFVDGEAFPSWFGTGTEDYFGYAWSTTERFAHAYHAQTEAPSHGFDGLFTMSRFHVLDPIPFSRGLRFDMEIWHWSETTLGAQAMLYWYARPGGADDFGQSEGATEAR
jgi:D-arabinan exo alpha-(1,3)/(1,5)-arabinofuranosidase (non-reducing end)